MPLVPHCINGRQNDGSATDSAEENVDWSSGDQSQHAAPTLMGGHHVKVAGGDRLLGSLPTEHQSGQTPEGGVGEIGARVEVASSITMGAAGQGPSIPGGATSSAPAMEEGDEMEVEEESESALEEVD